MIDTKQMILNAGFGEMRRSDLIHWDGCEYVHYSCAIKALVDELEETRKERDEYKQRLLDLEAESADPMDGSRICDQDGNRADMIKAVEETEGMWKDRDELDAMCGISD